MGNAVVNLGGKVANQAGADKVGLTVELYQAATWESAGAATATTTTDSDGLWAFASQDISKTWLVCAIDGTKKLLLDARNKIQLTEIDLITSLSVNTIYEHTAASGVTIDGLVIKDSGATFQDNTLKIENPAATFNYTIVAAAITAARQLNLPLITGTDTLMTLGLAQTVTGILTLTTPVIGDATGTSLVLTGNLSAEDLLIEDSDASHYLTITTTSNLTAARTLTIVPGDAARILTFTADATIGGTTSGTNTGDVTLAGTPDYITIANQVITRAKLDPADDLNTFASSVLATLVTDETGSGALVFGTAPTIAGGTHTALTGLGIRSTGTGAFDLTIANAENLTAGRTLTIQLGDAARTLILGASPSLSGTNTGDQTITLTGDVTGSGTGSFAATIAAAAVSLAKMANLAQDQFIGRTTASTGVPETATITAAARTVLDDTTVTAMVDTLGGAAATGTGGLARATSPTFVTPVLGTPASGTLTNCTGLPVAGIAASTSTALGVGSIELGHATDTSLTRSAAGKLAVEGIDVVLLSGAQTLTDKTLSTPALLTPTINGTVATTGLTLPAHTTSRITLNDTGIHRDISTSLLQLRGGAWAGGSGCTVVIYGHSESTQPGAIEIWTSNAAGNDDVLRARISGAVATATLTWANVTHTGFVLGGQMQTGAYEVEFTEMTAPAAPAANKARLYSEDNGAGKTRLVVLFPTGAAQVIATEP